MLCIFLVKRFYKSIDNIKILCYNKNIEKTRNNANREREISECQKRLKNLLILDKVTKSKKLGISKNPD